MRVGCCGVERHTSDAVASWWVVSHKLSRLCRAWKDPRLLTWSTQLPWRLGFFLCSSGYKEHFNCKMPFEPTPAS